jgi:hypothetical protein
MIWDGETCLALVDWKAADAGDPGVDMGAQRLETALKYGPDAPGHVLDGWQRESGREATDVPYWDAVAGVTTPTEIDRLPGFDDRGRPLTDLDAVHQRTLQSVPDGRPGDGHFIGTGLAWRAR